MSDLPGPEKPINWAALTAQIAPSKTAARQVYTPKIKARPRHRIAVMLHEAGWKAKDIAKSLGYTQARISVILNSQHPTLRLVRENFAREVADNVKDVQSRLGLYANEMLDIMVEHARQHDDRAASRLAARDILHMAGFTPVKKQFLMSANVPIDELRKVVGAVQDMHEVMEKRKDWEIKEVVNG